jgi:DinB superfamily
MTQTELAADVLNRGLQMLNTTLADFSDADILARPCPKANHTAWQLGQVIDAETRLVNGIKPGAAAPLPPAWEGKFTKETSSKDDPEFFPKKAELLDQFAKTRAATVAWIKTLTPADLGKATPEPVVQWIPTVGHLLAMLNAHMMMHLGQMQVIRRKLGKPILF